MKDILRDGTRSEADISNLVAMFHVHQVGAGSHQVWKEDLLELVALMDELKIPAGKRPKICPKIEKPQALENLTGIIEASGALMVAHGDLGVRALQLNCAVLSSDL